MWRLPGPQAQPGGTWLEEVCPDLTQDKLAHVCQGPPGTVVEGRAGRSWELGTRAVREARGAESLPLVGQTQHLPFRGPGGYSDPLHPQPNRPQTQGPRPSLMGCCRAQQSGAMSESSQ